MIRQGYLEVPALRIRVRFRSLAQLVFFGSVVSLPPREQLSAATAAVELTPYSWEVDYYLKADAISRPAVGGILFMGSSVFREWNRLEDQMAPLPVFNRSFWQSLVAVLEERKKLAYDRDQGGVDTQLNALDADRDLLQAKLDLRQIRLGELVSIVQLYKALGGGWQS